MLHQSYILEMVVLLAFSHHCIESLQILQIPPAYGGSHALYHNRLGYAMSTCGHNVTLWSIAVDTNGSKSLEINTLVENVTKIRVPIRMEQSLLDQMSVAFQAQSGPNATNANISAIYREYWVEACVQQQLAYNVHDMLKKQSFDIVVAHKYDMCPLMLSYMLNISKIIWVSGGHHIFDKAAWILSVPLLASYVPHAGSPFDNRMTFFERIRNLRFFTTDMLLNYWLGKHHKDGDALEFLSPPNSNFRRPVELAFGVRSLWLNGFKALDFPRPYHAGVFGLGALTEMTHAASNAAAQARNSSVQTADDSWTALMDKNDSLGTIFFSLGSQIQFDAIADEIKQIIVTALSNGKFSNYTIMWKIDNASKPLPNVGNSPHILFEKWFPQSRILSHKRTKLFLTHGGYNSVVEAATGGVPMLVLPFMTDGFGNGRRVQRLGMGITVNIRDSNFTAESLTETISTLLDEKYKRKSEQMATVLFDRPASAKELLSYQIRLAMKDRLWHLTSTAAKQLNFARFYFIDLFLCLTAVTLLFV